MVHILTAGGPSSHPLLSTLARENRQMLARCQHMDFELPNLQICEKQISALKFTQAQIKQFLSRPHICSQFYTMIQKWYTENSRNNS